MLNGTEREVNSFADGTFCFWNFVLPVLLHGTGHDEQ